MTIISNSHLHLSSDWDNISGAAPSMPTEFSNPPSPEKSGFCAWMRNFFNYLTGTFGEKLAPSKLNSALDNIFNSMNEWKHDDPIYFNNREIELHIGSQKQVSFRSMEKEGTTYIVSSACHDMANPTPIQHQQSGGRSVAEALSYIKNAYPHQQVKALIPIAQSNKLVFSTRGHFVLLEVDINAGKIQSAKIHDSKGGLLDTFYRGAKHLTKQLLADENLGLDKNFAVTSEHHSDQSLLNGNDCGRFSAYYAKKIIDNDLSKANAVDARAFFEQNFKKTS